MKNTPWDYVVFGVKEVHKVKNGAESTDRIVGQYRVRLVEERRTEPNPSRLLAEYSELGSKRVWLNLAHSGSSGTPRCRAREATVAKESDEFLFSHDTTREFWVVGQSK